MKVIALNGSPRTNGNTHQCLEIMSKELASAGIELEIIQVGNEPIRGCVACYHCLNNNTGHCIQKDKTNEWIDKMVEADGIILASPVYYGGIAGTFKCFLDRAFLCSGNKFHHKVGAAFVTLRRSGGLETYQQLNAYMNTMEMVMATSNYWGAIHGLDIDEIHQDIEGVEVITNLARNVAWLVQTLDHSKEAFPAPATKARTMTNFIR